jgi:hypothetical protein
MYLLHFLFSKNGIFYTLTEVYIEGSDPSQQSRANILSRSNVM